MLLLQSMKKFSSYYNVIVTVYEKLLYFLHSFQEFIEERK